MARSEAWLVTNNTGTYSAFSGPSCCMTESIPMPCAPSTAATLASVPGRSFIENRT